MSDNESQSTVLSDFEDDVGPEDQNITLIRLVKERAFLYTKADKRYSDRNLTERTWTQIATQIGWTKGEAKEKWTRLRNNFSKELVRRRAKTPSGSATCGSAKPWIYEAEMEFVKSHVSNSRGMSSSIRVAHRPTPNGSSTLSTLEPEPQAEVSPDSIEPEETPSMAGNCDQTTTPRIKRPSKCIDEVDQAMLAYIQTTKDQGVNNQPDEPLVMWFKSLLPMLKSLPPEQVFSFQINTMQEIQRLTTRSQSNYQTYSAYQSQYNSTSSSTSYDSQPPHY